MIYNLVKFGTVFCPPSKADAARVCVEDDAMKDIYPTIEAIPADCLVPPELQPDYLEPAVDRIHAPDGLAQALVDRHVEAGHGDDIAVIHHERGRSLTYRELSEVSGRLANVLVAKGVQPGERVAFRLPNRPEAIIVALAAWRIGAVVVPTPLQARASELRYFLQDAGASVLVADARAEHAEEMELGLEGTDVRLVVGLDGGSESSSPDWDSLLALASPKYEGRPGEPHGVGLIWHTGGTTGAPKGCYHTQHRFLLAGQAFGAATGARRGQRWAAAAPVGHALGFIYHTIFTLLHGATLVMVEDFGSPETLLRAMSDHRVDVFTGVMATWARLKDATDADPGLSGLSSLKRGYGMWQSASSGDVTEWYDARGLDLMNNFGSTSFATWILVPRVGDHVPGASLGRSSPGYEVVATEMSSRPVAPVPEGQPGQMAVKGPTGLTYWRRHDLQARDVVEGWTLVDDLIRFDAGGNAEYLGRTDYIISTAGYKVAPAEVENVLRRHPAVHEVAVLGAPDPIRREVVSAFVALKPGVAESDALRRELQDLVKQRLSPYKHPRRLEFISALPRDAVGKVRMSALQERLGAL
jgi:2-aminobenzoate-CoA ligase